MTGFKMPTGASNGYVLTSDASGVGSWELLPAGGEIDGSGTAGYNPRFSTSTNIDNSVIYQSGTSIGIRIATPAEKLHVEGDIRITSSGDIAFGDDNTRIYESANDLMITAEDDVYIIPDDDVFIRKD